MKFKNLETGNIIEVDKNDVQRIEKLKSYPDKFEVIGFKETKETKVEKEPKSEENKSDK